MKLHPLNPDSPKKMTESPVWMLCLDEEHLLAAAAYVQLNPVRTGIVKKAWVYPWSSASFHTGRSKRDPLGKDRQWGGWEKKWGEFLTGATRAKDQAIRQMTRTGRPAGNAAFVDLGIVKK
jgi:putative transposase